MTNTQLLRESIQASGLKISALMEQTGIKAYSTLRDKIDNKREFTASEISRLCMVLSLDSNQREAIFFADEAELNSAREGA